MTLCCVCVGGQAFKDEYDGQFEEPLFKTGASCFPAATKPDSPGTTAHAPRVRRGAGAAGTLGAAPTSPLAEGFPPVGCWAYACTHARGVALTPSTAAAAACADLAEIEPLTRETRDYRPGLDALQVRVDTRRRRRRRMGMRMISSSSSSSLSPSMMMKMPMMLMMPMMHSSDMMDDG